MSKNYEPDKHYLDRLEWQLTSEYRRANRLKCSPEKIAVPRGVAAVTLMAGILLTCVAVITAKEYIRDSWRKKIEIARAETDVLLNEARLASMRAQESEMKNQVSEGLMREEEYLAMKTASITAELELQKSHLNLDEVKVSGEVPRDDLYAPLVGGRDFVSERLELSAKEAQQDLEGFLPQFERLRELVDGGLVRENELESVQGELAARKEMVEKILKQIDLRKRFLAGELTARQVKIRNRAASADRNLTIAESKVASLETQMKRAEALASRGVIKQTEITQIQFALDAARAELKLAALEKDVLERENR